MTTENNHPKTDAVSFRQCLKGSWVDRILLIFLLVGIGFLWFQISQTLAQGAPTAYVYHGDKLLAKYPLPDDERMIHVAAHGEIGVSDIEISKHGIRFETSPCSTHYCTLSGTKKYTGSVIACVPNHIMVVIRGSDEKSDKIINFDAISE
ncbi:MAG: NusG domain II-containing protein [Ghiorsea sp.]|nr:NusG domain II-containing protein [Ghiorsea sp.]